MYPCIFKSFRSTFINPSDTDIDKDKNAHNLQILDSILDDEEDQFCQLINPSSINDTFTITNYKIPAFLKDNPTYLSLISCFSAEKCFQSLLMLSPSGLASEEMQKKDLYNRSPIHFACFGGSLKIIRELEGSGFDLNSKDNSGFLPSHYASMSGHSDVMKYLWTKGANVISLSNYPLKISPLSISCLYGNLEMVKFFCETVLQNSLQSNKPGSHYEVFFSSPLGTPLHLACIGGHDSIVNYFLSKNILIKNQINALDLNSCNPLLCACQNGSLACVKTLINYKNGKINLSMKGRKHLPLVDAAESGHLDIVQYLLKQKRINIDQETSQAISPLYAAIYNNYFDIVKLLIDNGAGKNLTNKKLGHLMLTAVGTDNFKIVDLLDKSFNIPYDELFELDIVCNSDYFVVSYDEDSYFRNKCIGKITYGNRYMQQACLFENKEMINFLLDKKITLDYVDIISIIKSQSFDFLEYLIENGIDVSDSKNLFKYPPIVSMIRWGNLVFVKKMISKGAILNKEIMTEYSCITLAFNNDDLDLFNYILEYEPEINSHDIQVVLHDAFSYVKSYTKKNPNISDESLQMIDILLDKVKIDFNEVMEDEYQTYISFAANKHCIKLLELFAKHGADFTNSALNYDVMINDNFIPVFNFLKDHGCNFENAIIRKNFFSFSRFSKNPLASAFTSIANTRNSTLNPILFILDYTSPKNIKKIKYQNVNLIDVFMKNDCCEGILKVYKITKSVFYPISKSKDDYEKWIKQTNNNELINIVFKSNS